MLANPKQWPTHLSEGERSWHVVQTDTTRASIICESLERQLGYESYYPQMRVMRPPPMRFITSSQRAAARNVMRPVLIPLFPGYPFVRFSMHDGRWHEIFDILGVYGLKVVGNLPAPLPTSAVDQIRKAEVGGAIAAETPVSELLYGKGSTVRIGEGPLQGFTGTVQELDESKRRAIVDLVMFGNMRSVNITTGQLSVVE